MRKAHSQQRSRSAWDVSKEPIAERAVIISTGPVLNLEVADLKLQPAGFPEKKAAAPNSENNAALRDVLEKTERLRILEALERSNWVVAGPRGAAGQLGMKRSTLQ